jgi:hypothetical protein
MKEKDTILNSMIIDHCLKVRINLISKKNDKQKIQKKNDKFFNIYYAFLIKFLKQILRLNFDIAFPRKFKKYLFIFNTHNQFLAKKALYEKKINQSYSLKNKFLVRFQIENSVNIPFWKIYFISLFILPIYWKSLNDLYFMEYENKIDRFSFFYDSIFTISVFKLFNLYFKLNKPEFLVMSNDHSDVNVGILYAAKNNNIKTVYLQHANISGLFPRMNFDYAFLYSIKVARKYELIGLTDTKFICVGNMKTDAFLGLNNNRAFDPNNLIVSLCINSLEELNMYIQLANCLSKLGKVKTIKIRLHPSLYMKKINIESNKVIKSNPLEELSFEYFKGVNINIAGNSSIIEEAIMVDTPTIFFDLNKNFNDYYGYIKDNSIIKVASDIKSIIDFLENYQVHISVIEKSNLYSSSIGTVYEGRTSDLIDNVLDSIEYNCFPNQNLVKESSFELIDAYILKS